MRGNLLFLQYNIHTYPKKFMRICLSKLFFATFLDLGRKSGEISRLFQGVVDPDQYVFGPPGDLHPDPLVTSTDPRIRLKILPSSRKNSKEVTK